MSGLFAVAQKVTTMMMPLYMEETKLLPFDHSSDVLQHVAEMSTCADVEIKRIFRIDEFGRSVEYGIGFTGGRLELVQRLPMSGMISENELQFGYMLNLLVPEFGDGDISPSDILARLLGELKGLRAMFGQGMAAASPRKEARP